MIKKEKEIRNLKTVNMVGIRKRTGERVKRKISDRWGSATRITYDFAPISPQKILVSQSRNELAIRSNDRSESPKTAESRTFRANTAAYSYDGDAVIFIFAEHHHSMRADDKRRRFVPREETQRKAYHRLLTSLRETKRLSSFVFLLPVLCYSITSVMFG